MKDLKLNLLEKKEMDNVRGGRTVHSKVCGCVCVGGGSQGKKNEQESVKSAFDKNNQAVILQFDYVGVLEMR